MEAPDFSLKNLTGEIKTYSEIKGQKLTILVFWSTWSKKSESALKRMQQLFERYGGQGLSIIGINVDDPVISTEAITEIRTTIGRLNTTYPMLIDDGLVSFHDYGVIAVPTTVILDKDRVIREELSGYPLVGSEDMVDFVIATMEDQKRPVVVAKKIYQPSKSAIRFYNMGKTAQRSKPIAETAEMWFKKAIEADDGFVLPHLGLGKIYLKRGDTAQAKAEYKEALDKEPDNPIALCEMGMILVEESKTSEGENLFDAARKAEESYAPCYYYAGYALGKSGKLEDALKLFADAEKINPFDYNNFVYQGKLFEELKDQKKTLEAYKRAVELILHID